MTQMRMIWIALAGFILLGAIGIAFSRAKGEVCMYYFYGQGCPGCAKTDPIIDQLEEKHPQLKVHRLEIYFNESNLLLIQQYYNKFQVPVEQQVIPVVFISDTYFKGSTSIRDDLKEEIYLLFIISLKEGSPCPSLDGAAPPESSDLSFLVVSMGALVDSINPCAIAVLLLFNTFLIAGGKRRALRVGLAYTASIYIAYFLFGLGLFIAIQTSGLTLLFYRFVGILAIVIGVLNLKDYFRYGVGCFTMELPRSWGRRIKFLMAKATSPLAAFLTGFAVCLIELPCTGGPYFAILGLLAEKTTRILAVPLLLYYNLIFVLPLVVLTVILYLGYSSVDRAAKWKESNVRILHLVTGLVMIGLGVVVFFDLV